MNEQVAGLKQALDYTRLYRDQVFVVKLGGEVVASAEAREEGAVQIALLERLFHEQCEVVDDLSTDDEDAGDGPAPVRPKSPKTMRTSTLRISWSSRRCTAVESRSMFDRYRVPWWAWSSRPCCCSKNVCRQPKSSSSRSPKRTEPVARTRPVTSQATVRHSRGLSPPSPMAMTDEPVP